MKPITEDKIETFAIAILQTIGWEFIHGLSIAPGAEKEERDNFEQILLVDRLRKSVTILNPNIPHDAQEQAIQKALRVYSPELLHNNETFHQLLVEKVKVPYQHDGFGSDIIHGPRAYQGIFMVDYYRAYLRIYL